MIDPGMTVSVGTPSVSNVHNHESFGKYHSTSIKAQRLGKRQDEQAVDGNRSKLESFPTMAYQTRGAITLIVGPTQKEYLPMRFYQFKSPP